MNSVHLQAGSSTSRRLRKSKNTRKGRPRGKTSSSASGQAAPEPQLAAAGSLTRTKALLLAALRVWELKHRIGD